MPKKLCSCMARCTAAGYLLGDYAAAALGILAASIRCRRAVVR